jgi:hypothetical protein
MKESERKQDRKSEREERQNETSKEDHMIVGMDRIKREMMIIIIIAVIAGKSQKVPARRDAAVEVEVVIEGEAIQVAVAIGTIRTKERDIRHFFCAKN